MGTSLLIILPFEHVQMKQNKNYSTTSIPVVQNDLIKKNKYIKRYALRTQYESYNKAFVNKTK